MPCTSAQTVHGEPKRLIGAHSTAAKNTRLELKCQLHSMGDPITSKVFVDTGAEVNLVRRGLLKPEAFAASEIPLSILAANQLPIAGGHRETVAVLAFSGTEVGEKGPAEVRIPTLLYEADITDDLIVSYGWLAENAVEVSAKRHGVLVVLEGKAVWVCGVKKPKAQPQDANQATVQVVTGQKTTKKPLRALDLFSGTGSVRRVLEGKGYHVTSLDMDPKWKADFICDVLGWDVRKHFPPGHFDIVTASPPCTEYSRAMLCRARNLARANTVVEKTLEVIEYLQPRLWWMENPRNGVLRYQRCVEGLAYTDQDYCQFAEWGYQKPTRFWGSAQVCARESRLCDGVTCGNLVAAQGVPKKRAHWNCLGGNHIRASREEKFRIPPRLVEYLCGLDGPTQGPEPAATTSIGVPQKPLPINSPMPAKVVNTRFPKERKSRPQRKGPQGVDHLSEEFQEAVAFVRHHGVLTMPGEGPVQGAVDQEEWSCDEDDRAESSQGTLEECSEEEEWELAHRLVQGSQHHGQVRMVQGVVEARDAEESTLVEAAKEKILEEFRETSLSGKYPVNPPIRGPFGEAEIWLRTDAVPVSQIPFRISGERRAAWVGLVDEGIKQQKMEPGYGAWNTPSFPVPKKTPGRYRLVQDLRPQNEATIKDGHPLPRIGDILERQGKFRMWSVLDLVDGFHQMPMKVEHRPITCMSTPRGTMQWKVLVMGLKNAGSQFQRMMEWVLKDLPNVDPYIDDIIIGSTGETEEELVENHARDLRATLEALGKNTLVCDPKKCKLFMREVGFCGHILREGRRSPDPGKLRPIQQWELPETVTALRGFLGLTNYFSEYVPKYADLAAPLMEKLKLPRKEGKKGSKQAVRWKEGDKAAFEALKAALAQSLEVYQADPDAPFRLSCDASDTAIGAALQQEREGKWVPVCFYSRKLAGPQKNWTPREKETYAIVASLRKWAGIIGFQPVLIHTDHKSLEDWVGEHIDTPSGPRGRRARWHETLSQFDLEVKYIPGEENTVPDALSRWAYPATSARQDVSFHGTAEAHREVKEMLEEEVEKNHKALACGVSQGPGAAESPTEIPAGPGTVQVQKKIKESKKGHRKGPRPPGTWTADEYAVRPEVVQEIMGKLVEKEKQTQPVDLFAAESNHRWPRWFGKGGEEEDAWKVHWGKVGELLWCNPPYADLNRVVDKFVADQCTMVLIVPNWTTTKWFKRLRGYVLTQQYYPRGSQLFELNGRPCKGTRWGTWVVRATSQDPPESTGKMDYRDFVTPQVTAGGKGRKKVVVAAGTGKPQGKKPGPVRFQFAPQPESPRPEMPSPDPPEEEDEDPETPHRPRTRAWERAQEAARNETSAAHVPAPAQGGGYKSQ